MFVKSIKLLNIRSFSEIEIELSKNINLLVGNNNSGKSTIIKSLFRLQNLQSLGLDDIRKSSEYGRIFIDIENISAKEGVAFTLNNKNQMPKFPDTDCVKVLFGIFTSIIETQKGQEALYFDNNLKHKMDGIGRVKVFDDTEKEVGFSEFFGLPNTESYNNNFIYPFFAKRKTNYYARNMGTKEAFHVSEDLGNITSKIQKISNPSHPKSRQFLTQVKDILGFNIGVIPHGENQSNTGIFVNDSTVIPVDSMGEGVVNILGLIVMLLTEDRKLYLIEELENDIHPQALKKLLNLILEKSANNQFVISTHSNIVVKYLGIGPSKIFQIKWTPYEKEEEDRLPTSLVRELENDPLIKMKLLEDLGYDIFDFELYKSYLILEESSAEKIIRDFLIPEFFPALQNKIKTIAASGADDLAPRFHDFLRLFVFIHQNPIYFSRAWVFADGDAAGLSNIGSLKNTFSNWPEEHFINFSKKYFEEFYPIQFHEEFALINSISDKRKRQQKKIEFTGKIISWINEDRNLAKKDFAISAKEVIDYLKVIEGKLLLS